MGHSTHDRRHRDGCATDPRQNDGGLPVWLALHRRFRGRQVGHFHVVSHTLPCFCFVVFTNGKILEQIGFLAVRNSWQLMEV